MNSLARKILVFDIDGTLLHRQINKVPHLQHDFKSNGRFIYLRPNLHHLLFHFPTLMSKANIVLWTSMKRRNAEKINSYFSQVGLKFQKLYCQENCREDLSKDLTIVAKDYGVDVGQVYLIDDSPNKRVGNQNLIYIKNYDGSEPQDKQLIRIIQQIYQLLQIPFQIEWLDDAELFNLQNVIKKFKFDKNADTEDKIMELKNEKGVGKQNKQKFEKQKTKQGKQEKGKQSMQENRKQIKFHENSKVVVFDLSKTLIAKKKEHEMQEQIDFLKNPSKIQGNIIYNRPHIDSLKVLLDSHPDCDIKLLVWTTMTGKSTVAHCRQVVNNLPAPFADVMNGVPSKQSPAKDLRVICQKYGVSLQNTILVDDSTYKQVSGQNFINILPYNGDATDIEMIRTVIKIDEFLGCDQLCPIKKLAQRYSKELIIAAENHQKLLETREQEMQQKIEVGVTVKLDIKEKSKIGCIVFDINETLLVRVQDRVEGVAVDGRNKHYFIYLRPYLQDLAQFLDQHRIVVCLWSTIKSHNCEIFRKLLSERGLTIKELFAGEQLVDGRKDLNLVAHHMGISVQEIVLVDDSSNKRVADQNFVHIRSFEAENRQDDGLLQLIRELEKLVCTNIDCKFKQL